MLFYLSIKHQEIHKNQNKIFHLKKYFETQNLAAQKNELQTQLTNKENLRFLVNKWSIKLSQEAEELKVSKEKLKEYLKRLQGTVEELEGKNYYLKRKGRVLRGFVRNYQGQIRVLKGFILIVFILRQLMVGLYLLDLFDDNNTYITIF